MSVEKMTKMTRITWFMLGFIYSGLVIFLPDDVKTSEIGNVLNVVVGFGLGFTAMTLDIKETN